MKMIARCNCYKKIYGQFSNGHRWDCPVTMRREWWRGTLTGLAAVIAMIGFWWFIIWGAIEGYKHVGH